MGCPSQLLLPTLEEGEGDKKGCGLRSRAVLFGFGTCLAVLTLTGGGSGARRLLPALPLTGEGGVGWSGVCAQARLGHQDPTATWQFWRVLAHCVAQTGTGCGACQRDQPSPMFVCLVCAAAREGVCGVWCVEPAVASQLGRSCCAAARNCRCASRARACGTC